MDVKCQERPEDAKPLEIESDRNSQRVKDGFQHLRGEGHEINEVQHREDSFDSIICCLSRIA